MTTPPEVVRTRASSTVLVKASSLVNLDLAGMAEDMQVEVKPQSIEARRLVRFVRTEPVNVGFQ